MKLENRSTEITQTKTRRNKKNETKQTPTAVEQYKKFQPKYNQNLRRRKKDNRTEEIFEEITV